MCCCFMRHHYSYSEPSGQITVSDNITGFDMKLVLEDLSFFNSEDCDYMYGELINHAKFLHRHYCKVTNVFQILYKKMKIEYKAADGDEDDMFAPEHPIWYSLHRAVDNLADRFEELVTAKINFVDFDTYLAKMVVNEKLNKEELFAVNDLLSDLEAAVVLPAFDSNARLSTIIRRISKIAVNLPDVFDKLVDNKINNNDNLKSAFNKCNFREVLKEYVSNTDLIKLALYKDYEYEDGGLSEKLEELSDCLRR